MSKVYHFVRRTRYWLDTDDEQHLKLFLYIENTHTSPITVTVDWSWAGSGSDPYGIDGVSESKTLQPGEIWQNVKDLLRNPPIDVGATTIDKIIADVKTIIDSVEYIKEIQFIPTIYRKMPEYMLWNFDDHTWQGWNPFGDFMLISADYHSPPCCAYFHGDYSGIERSFNFTGVKSIILRLWAYKTTEKGIIIVKVIDIETNDTIYSNEHITPRRTWCQVEDDISIAANKNVKIKIYQIFEDSFLAKFHIDDIELYVSY